MKTNPPNAVSTNTISVFRSPTCTSFWPGRAFLWFWLVSLYATNTNASTAVQGNISGIWTPAGNPYIVVDNCTVPPGQTLTLQPGVVLNIESNFTVTANGSMIQAVGTPTQRIVIQAFPRSNFWNTISLINAPGTNRFKYCDFANAKTALTMGVYGGYRVMYVEVMNCTFSNCVSQAIYGEAQGVAGCFYSQDATLNPVIKNSRFSSMTNGCVFRILGQAACGGYAGYGYANPRILGNEFQGLAGTGFVMSVGSYAASGKAVFINNTLVNCRTGVDAADPWDARVQDNIFVGATNAVKVSGELSREVSYNDFYLNATNFTGLPAAYGEVLWANDNGTPSDVFYNIYQDPLFISSTDFHLATNSACIDAGTPDWAFSDMCLPPYGPSLGTSFPDLGAYGGPDACNWLDDVPLLPSQASMSISDGLIWLNWGAIPRSDYQIQYLTNLPPVGTTDAWLDFPNGHVVAVDKPTSFAVSPAPGTNKMRFFRLQSLGRTPGN